MSLYLGMTGDDGASHELVAEGAFEEQELKKSMIEGGSKEVYDAALTDGATHDQAQLMAFGVDVSEMEFNNDDMSIFPRLGWYRAKEEYAQIFCREWEMKE